MTDLTKTIAPKSDQMNADDLIGGDRTIRITRVSLTPEGEQPIAINFEGDGGKPYKPCKTMRRLMVHVWGGDGGTYAGRRMTLFRDEKVRFGGETVGGIRISHMSDIKQDRTVSLTDKRGSRKPYTVMPLPQEGVSEQRTQQPSAPQIDPSEVDRLRTVGDEAAARGMGPLGAFWNGRSAAEKVALGGKSALDAWKKSAAEADAAALDEDASDAA